MIVNTLLRGLMAGLIGCSTLSVLYGHEPPPPLVQVCPPEDLFAGDKANVTIRGLKDEYAILRFEADVRPANADRFVSLMTDAQTQGFEFIVLELNTPGGLVVDGHRMASAIEGSGKPVYCIVDGEASSMGFYILQSCARRLMTKTSTLMTHEPYEPSLYHTNRYALRSALDRLEGEALEMIAYESRRMNITRDEFVKRTAGESTDWRMTAVEALKYGAADEVWPTVEAATRSARDQWLASRPSRPSFPPSP